MSHNGICKVLPELYIGDIQGAQNLTSLKQIGITHVLQAMGGIQPIYPQHFTYKVLNVRDIPSENLLTHLHGAADFIKQVVDSRGKVFVHCWAGVSRSATCVMAFLMKHLSMSMNEAEVFVRRARPFINPNDGFRKQLK